MASLSSRSRSATSSLVTDVAVVRVRLPDGVERIGTDHHHLDSGLVPVLVLARRVGDGRGLLIRAELLDQELARVEAGLPIKLVPDRRHPLESLADDERAARRLADVKAQVGRHPSERSRVRRPEGLDHRQLYYELVVRERPLPGYAAAFQAPSAGLEPATLPAVEHRSGTTPAFRRDQVHGISALMRVPRAAWLSTSRRP